MQPDARPAKEALSDLCDRIRDALVDGYPPESCVLASDVTDIYELALWCRDAGIAFVKTGFAWGEIAEMTEVPDATLQYRWSRWHERGGLRECG